MKIASIKYSVLALCATMFFGCSEDNVEDSGNAMGNVTISLDVLEPKSTRAGETIETSALDKKISNMWLVQYVYNNSGKEIEADRAIRYVTVTNNKINTTLRTTLTGETTKLYLIANTHDDEAFSRIAPPSEAELQKASMDIDYNTIEQGLPMSSVVSLSGFKDGDAISAQLKRRVAKVVVNVSSPTTSSDNIEILNVQLQNTKSSYYLFSDSKDDIKSGDSQNFSSETWSNSNGGKNTYTYYIPASYASDYSEFPYLYINAVTNSKFVTYRLRLQGEGASNTDTWREVENNHYYVLNAPVTGSNNTGDESSNKYIYSSPCKLVDHGDSPENCYVIDSDDNDAMYYRFPVSQINEYRKLYDKGHLITNDTIYHAKVIWWSTGSQDAAARQNSWVSIVGTTCHGNDGHVIIKRKDSEGNAVAGNALIGVFNSKEELLWSWHIWQTPKVDDLTIGGNTFMSMNLGAVEFSPSVSRAYEFYNSVGLYYQWGRKDPFGTDFETNTSAINLNYVLSNYPFKIENFSELGISDVNANITASRTKAVKNPTTFFYNTSADEVENWAGCDGNSSWNNSGSKTVFDPCPYGYRVPTAAELAVLENNTFVSDAGRTVIEYKTSQFYVPIAAWLTGVGTATTAGTLQSIDYSNAGGSLYSSTTGNGQQKARYLLLKSMGNNNANADAARTYARPIRPIKMN